MSWIEKTFNVKPETLEILFKESTWLEESFGIKPGALKPQIAFTTAEAWWGRYLTYRTVVKCPFCGRILFEDYGDFEEYYAYYASSTAYFYCNLCGAHIIARFPQELDP